MSRFGSFVRRVLEKLASIFYEGPDPPKRLGQMVEMFAREHPNATRQQWADFARKHAEETYRSGYMRGMEWSERDLERREHPVPPELLARTYDHDWSFDNVPRGIPRPDGVPPDAKNQRGALRAFEANRAGEKNDE